MMREKERKSRDSWRRRVLVVMILLMIANDRQDTHRVKLAVAQTVGNQPALNLAFNPHLSPVFGYGLGLPYGAYNFSPLGNPLLASSILSANHLTSENSFLGKIHAKSFLKKLGYSPFLGYRPFLGGYKSKWALKHPEYAFTPYGMDYGYGKHYGSAMVPNNPYKSGYGDTYYNNNGPMAAAASSTSSSTIMNKEPYVVPPQQYNEQSTFAQYNHNNYDENGYHALAKTTFIKPLIKAGVLLTTAAILGKKSLDIPTMKLNPAGMIGNRGVF